MSEPKYREFNLKAMVVAEKPGGSSAECIQLLTQVMDIYRDLSPRGREAVASWFNASYGEGGS